MRNRRFEESLHEKPRETVQNLGGLSGDGQEADRAARTERGKIWGDDLPALFSPQSLYGLILLDCTTIIS
jgi:hypothetical protein